MFKYIRIGSEDWKREMNIKRQHQKPNSKKIKRLQKKKIPYKVIGNLVVV
jgi:hypothetical protein